MATGGQEASLAGGFVYEGGALAVHLVTPTAGSQAGGSFVRVVGVGFQADAAVRLDGVSAADVTVHGPTLLTARTPPHGPGAVDVSVTSDGATDTLPGGFVYYDPTALYGGTWGPPLGENLNVTVLDALAGEPIADAFVIVGADAQTPHQGLTDAQGQITFGGPDLGGPATVTAAKAGYETGSIAAFDATNATLYLLPSGGVPSPVTGSVIQGKVLGLGKMVVVPAGRCADADPAALPAPLCAPCAADAECGAGRCLAGMDGVPACATPCGADTACPDGFACLAQPGGGSVCLPTAGRKEAHCFPTAATIWTQPPALEAFMVAPPGGEYSVETDLREQAVVCLGGYVPWGGGDFVPLAFGVRRHIQPQEGFNPGKDVEIAFPMDRTLRIRLDGAPMDHPAVEFQGAQVHWDLGSDGMFTHELFVALVYEDGDGEALAIPYQPRELTGDVYDARLLVRGFAFGFDDLTGAQTPTSQAMATDLLPPADDPTLWRDADGAWTVDSTGAGVPMRDVFALGPETVWAVGDRGALIAWDGAAWSPQAAPTSADLRGIWASGPTDAWAVGQDTLLRFDGTLWTPWPAPGPTGDLRAITGTGPADVVVVAADWGGSWRFDGQSWASIGGVGADLRDVSACGPGDVWAVGGYGTARHLEGAGTPWSYVTTGSFETLLSVHCLGADSTLADTVFAVGSAGTFLHGGASGFTEVPAPTPRTLRAVVALAADDVWAVGDGGLVLHFDGSALADVTPPEAAGHRAWTSLWGDPATGSLLALGAAEVQLGPMLRVPEIVAPDESGVLEDLTIRLTPPGGPAADIQILAVTQPGFFGIQTPIWTITLAGDASTVAHPDLPAIAGLPAPAPGTPYKLTVVRIHRPGLSVSGYDLLDLDPMGWTTWSSAERPLTIAPSP